MRLSYLFQLSAVSLQLIIGGSLWANPLDAAEENENHSIYLRGSAKEGISADRITALSFDTLSNNPDFVREILLENPDIIYIHEAYNEKAVHTLYKQLEGHYAHFYLITEQSPENLHCRLVISKLPVENPEDSSSSLEFTISDSDESPNQFSIAFQRPN